MNITKTDSTNFRATMNISQVKNYRHYWNEVAKNFEVATTDGHTFAHHLLIEQSFNYLKDSK